MRLVFGHFTVGGIAGVSGRHIAVGRRIVHGNIGRLNRRAGNKNQRKQENRAEQDESNVSFMLKPSIAIFHCDHYTILDNRGST